MSKRAVRFSQRLELKVGAGIFVCDPMPDRLVESSLSPVEREYLKERIRLAKLRKIFALEEEIAAVSASGGNVAALRIEIEQIKSGITKVPLVLARDITSTGRRFKAKSGSDSSDVGERRELRKPANVNIAEQRELREPATDDVAGRREPREPVTENVVKWHEPKVPSAKSVVMRREQRAPAARRPERPRFTVKAVSGALADMRRQRLTTDGIAIANVLLDHLNEYEASEVLGIPLKYLDKIRHSPIYTSASGVRPVDAMVIVDVLEQQLAERSNGINADKVAQFNNTHDESSGQVSTPSRSGIVVEATAWGTSVVHNIETPLLSPEPVSVADIPVLDTREEISHEEKQLAADELDALRASRGKVVEEIAYLKGELFILEKKLAAIDGDIQHVEQLHGNHPLRPTLRLKV